MEIVVEQEPDLRMFVVKSFDQALVAFVPQVEKGRSLGLLVDENSHLPLGDFVEFYLATFLSRSCVHLIE